MMMQTRLKYSERSISVSLLANDKACRSAAPLAKAKLRCSLLSTQMDGQSQIIKVAHRLWLKCFNAEINANTADTRRYKMIICSIGEHREIGMKCRCFIRS